ncbi:HK97 family phage prohead protease [Planktotalea sp.]|uniref:HK97 family phage prohead protease n=1 Tax=Planktotalea sp. TaxID=2029877 RepID=UPI003D6C1FCD
MQFESGLERKFCRFGDELTVKDGVEIEGYASLFGQADQGGDVVAKGAYGASLKTLNAQGRRVKMLWQHDPSAPIGVWDDVREDERGLYVKGRLLESVARGREAAALIQAEALDGLSIGYRTKKATRGEAGTRCLQELELWEVSLVTFPMLPSARVGAKHDRALHESREFRALADVLRDAALEMKT